jgi:hypothetical protein
MSNGKLPHLIHPPRPTSVYPLTASAPTPRLTSVYPLTAPAPSSKLTKLTAPCFCFVVVIERPDQRPALTAASSPLTSSQLTSGLNATASLR